MPSKPAPTIACLEGATKAYGAHRVLEGFDFALEAGSVTALLGPNGAGKSTVAGLLAGRLLPDEGRVRLFGHDPSHQLARARMGIMLQAGGLPETLTVAEAVDLERQLGGTAWDTHPCQICLTSLHHKHWQPNRSPQSKLPV